MDELVHVRAPPVVTRQAGFQSVFFPARVVGEIHNIASPVFFGIRVKIIVEHHAIHVIAFHHVEHGVERAGLRFGFAGIEPGLPGVMADDFRMRTGDVVERGRRFGFGMRGAEGIEPCVDFQPARVRLGDGQRERIIKRLRHFSLDAGEVFRPRFERRGVNRVRHGAHLEKNGVQMKLHRAVEQRNQLCLLLRDRQAGFGRPVNVRDGRNPRGAEFPCDRRRGNFFVRREKPGGRQKQNYGDNGKVATHGRGEMRRGAGAFGNGFLRLYGRFDKMGRLCFTHAVAA